MSEDMFIDFREGGREREISMRDRDIGLLVDYHRRPDWGSNPQPFGVGDATPVNRATWAGLNLQILKSIGSKEK